MSAAVPLDRRQLQNQTALRAPAMGGAMLAIVGGAMLATASSGVAQELPYVRLGSLSCRALPGPEFSTESGSRMLCQFRSDSGGKAETYFGRLQAFRGVTPRPDEIHWDVLAPKGSVRPRWLAAEFSGRATRALSVPVRQDSLTGARAPFVVLQPIAGGSAAPADELVLTAAE